MWLDTIRAAEDCINLLNTDWDDAAFEAALLGIPLLPLAQDPRPLLALRPRLIARFNEPFVNRFQNLMMQAGAMALAFAGMGFVDIARELATVGNALGYFQSRRRHLVAMLHVLPTLCRGHDQVGLLDPLPVFAPIIEFEALPLVGAQQALLIDASRERLGVAADVPLHLPMLDPLFLEPERSRIVEMPLTEQGLAMLSAREDLPADRLFSAAELRNDILMLESAYAEFDLAGTGFAPAAALIRKLSRDFIERDFWIKISPAALNALLDEVAAPATLRAALLRPAHDYVAALDSYSPFVEFAGIQHSTVTLLSRFLYYWRSQSLDRIKRFQIRSGFIFEKAVAAELQALGFAVQDITRIDHHEFDVVTLRDGEIWNVQCKNNFTDLERATADPRRFARYNHRLVRSYERALTKERNREAVLKGHLGLDTIRHMVLSRFPVVTDNPRILVYSRIADFPARADALVAAETAGAGQ